MSYLLREKEFEALMGTAANKRYEYTVKKIADWEEVWSLHNSDGWVLAGPTYGKEVFPIWPHPRFAQMCAADNWHDREPKMIPVGDWLHKWLPGLSKDERLIVVFPVPGLSGADGPVVSPERLQEDIMDQLDLVE